MAFEKKNIGILGGTFDPVHRGHIMMAQKAAFQYGLEHVFFLPAGHSPHKRFAGDEMAKHRSAMLEAALFRMPDFSVSYYEIKSKDTCYTYKSIKYFKNTYPDSKLYFILGADSLFYFDEWRCPDLICKYAVMLVIPRGELDDQRVDKKIDSLSEKYGGSMYRVEMKPFNVSSRDIRENVRLGRPIGDMVPREVEEYIKDNALYTGDHDEV